MSDLLLSGFSKNPLSLAIQKPIYNELRQSGRQTNDSPIVLLCILGQNLSCPTSNFDIIRIGVLIKLTKLRRIGEQLDSKKTNNEPTF
jgi:hypothetical protein